MTDPLYGNLPSFNHGQVLSARAHMNALNRYIGSVRDDCFGTSIPYMGRQRNMMRHKWNTLAYYVVATSAGTITYDGNTVASWGGSGTYSGTADLSSYDFTEDEFYEVVASGVGVNAGESKLYRLYETTTPSYPSLTTFADATTPTAAQWQDLSDYADELGNMLDHPYALASRWQQRGWATIPCSFVHKARYLYIMSHIVAPDLHNSESYLTVIIYPGEGGEQQLSYNATGGGADVRIWIDLTTDVPGLAFGDIYNLDLQFTSEGGEGPPDYELYAIYETPYTEETFDEPQAPGYAVPAEWEHGDYVYGSTSSPKVQETTANLEALDDIVQAVNFACPERYEGAVAGFLFGVRHRRWLHYLSNSYWDDEEGDTIIEDGVLAYELRGAETTVTLPASPTVDTWMAVDLDSVDGLWPGTHYWIGGVRYAIEDIEY